MRGLKTIAAIAVMGVGMAAAAQTPTPAPAQPEAEKKICRKTLETGSLVKKTRQCFTRTEWARIAEAARSHTQYIQDGGMGRPAGGP